MDFVFKVDQLPDKTDKYRARDAFASCGGNAANAAIAVKRLGGEPILTTRVGMDAIGNMIIDDLEKEGIDTSAIHRVEGGKSSFSSVLIDRNGERQIMNFRGLQLGDNAEWLNEARQFDALLADNRWPPLTLKAIEVAKSKNVPIVVDAEPPFDIEVVEHATHIAFSHQGLVDFIGAQSVESALLAADNMLDGWVCVTDGENGTYYMENGAPTNIPAVAVEAVDTLGAGDVWHGALTLMLAEGADLRQAITFANAAGTLKCTRTGGRHATPDRSETLNFLQRHQVLN